MATIDIPQGRIEGWLEERLRARSLFAALLHVRIPASAATYYLGGITLFLFGVQVVTGTLLALYYQPTPDTAYDSVKTITSVVDFGWLIRSVHHWGANLMIVSLVLHLLRIFVQAAYKYPRELTWVVGVGLLGVTIGFGFTGYLLPWDQEAFWATTVGTEIAGSVPLAGDALLNLLRGGPDVTGATLSRFFGMHVLVLPLLLGLLMVVHLTIVHQLGLASPRHPEPRPSRPGQVAEPVREPLKPFFPHYMLDEVIAWMAVLAVLVVLASVWPAGLQGKADPLVTPEHIKPEWYFLAVYQLLKDVAPLSAIGPETPRLVGVLIPIAALVVLILLPFIDKNREVVMRKRPIALLLAAATMVVLVILSIRGQVS
jgi:ubiquinol-cytochrome c reductase cytochrome b subunit